MSDVELSAIVLSEPENQTTEQPHASPPPVAVRRIGPEEAKSVAFKRGDSHLEIYFPTKSLRTST